MNKSVTRRVVRSAVQLVPGLALPLTRVCVSQGHKCLMNWQSILSVALVTA